MAIYEYTEDQIKNDLYQILMSKFKPELFRFPRGFEPLTRLEKIVIRNLVRNDRVEMRQGRVFRMI